MMKHDAITQVSVRLPSDLVSAIDATARDECRTRSAQIEFFLRTSIEAPRERTHEDLEQVAS